jgi:hypothetical protein
VQAFSEESDLHPEIYRTVRGHDSGFGFRQNWQCGICVLTSDERRLLRSDEIELSAFGKADNSKTANRFQQC